MRISIVGLTLMALSLFWGPPAALAQDAKVARGTIAGIGGQSLTVNVAGMDMKFSVDNKTMVEARGGSTKASRAAAAGKSGPHLDELLKTGQSVTVTYKDMSGALHATAITTVPKPSSPKPDMRSAGVVKAIGGDWITINGRSGGGASFEQTFTIDPATKVYAKGASSAAGASGGKAPISALIAAGDRVSVSYQKLGNALHASDVHVTMKASH